MAPTITIHHRFVKAIVTGSRSGEHTSELQSHRDLLSFPTRLSSDLFSGFEVNESGLRCYFQNGPNDHNPSSFCEGNRDRIVLQGQHGFDTDGVTLATTPNRIFDWVGARYGNPDEKTDDWIMRRYKGAVHDRASLAQFLDDCMVEMVAPAATSMYPPWMERMLGNRDRPNTH